MMRLSLPSKILIRPCLEAVCLTISKLFLPGENGAAVTRVLGHDDDDDDDDDDGKKVFSRLVVIPLYLMCFLSAICFSTSSRFT
jgi:hypothetical protein